MENLTPELKKLLETTLKFAKKYAKEIGNPLLITEMEYKVFIREQEKQLEKSWNKNKFIICANLKTDALENCIGINSVMGWNSEISVAEYFQKIHLDYLSPYLEWSIAVYELSKELRDSLKPLEQVYQLQVPLLHENGKYYWCTMQGFPIRLDASGNMVIHCNIYQRMEEMNEYNHRLFQPFLVDKLEIMDDWNKRLAAKMKKFALAPLNNKEIKVIKLGLEGNNTAKIALKMNIPINSVMTYKKNIKKRGQEIGGKVFGDADEVGNYFKMMSWVLPSTDEKK